MTEVAGAAADVRAAVVEALERVADQLPESGPGRREGTGERLVVRSTMHVSACPAATALDGEAPFEATAHTVAWELSCRASDRLVHGSRDPSLGHASATPAAALALAVAEETDNWAFDWWASASEAERCVAAAGVARRLAGLARLASTWPPTPPVAVPRRRVSWFFPGRALQLAGRADLVAGRRNGDHTIVVALGGDHGPLTRARLAFEAVVETLDLNRPPAAVLGLLPDAGRRWLLRVDGSVLGDGVTAAATAARVALGARRRDAAGLDRRPGPACARCAHAGSCAPGNAWLAGPGRLRSGFLPPDANPTPAG